MLILKTVVHETIWGGKKLTPLSGSTCEKIGHLYSVNCNAHETNMILNGEYQGQTLNDFFSANKSRYGLEEYEYFPLIIALVEANDNLSIQVHPDDQTASILNPQIKLGKNESWFFLEAPDSGYIYNGCRCASLEELKEMLINKKMEVATDHLMIKPHDYTYVVAGTLHALSKGSLVYEIEENAGCTYRFYDFDRVDKNGNKRPLQIPEAFYAIHLENKSEVSRYDGGPIEERRYLTQYFQKLEKFTNQSGTLQVLTVISGEFSLDSIFVRPGMSILLEPSESIVINGGAEIMMAEPKRLDGRRIMCNS